MYTICYQRVAVVASVLQTIFMHHQLSSCLLRWFPMHGIVRFPGFLESFICHLPSTFLTINFSKGLKRHCQRKPTTMNPNMECSQILINLCKYAGPQSGSGLWTQNCKNVDFTMSKVENGFNWGGGMRNPDNPPAYRPGIKYLGTLLL